MVDVECEGGGVGNIEHHMGEVVAMSMHGGGEAYAPLHVDVRGGADGIDKGAVAAVGNGVAKGGGSVVGEDATNHEAIVPRGEIL